MKRDAADATVDRCGLAVLQFLNRTNRSPIIITKRQIPEKIFDRANAMIAKHFAPRLVHHRRAFNARRELQLFHDVYLSTETQNARNPQKMKCFSVSSVVPA